MKAAIIILGVLFGSTAFAQRQGWKPDFATTQYAGSIGFVSGGFGYRVFKDKAKLSFHYGFVPASKGGPLNIVASKLLFNTWKIKISNSVDVHPLSAGIMISYHFGEALNSSWSEYRYPKGYYWWRPSIRAHINTQSYVVVKLKNKRVKSIAYFIDFNANDLYLVSYFQNRKALGLRDIVKVGYGLRVNF
jgi:hypothetical protein